MVTGKQITIIALLLSISALVLNAHYDWGLFEFFKMQTYQGCTIQQGNGLALIPFYGYYACEPSSTYQVSGNYGVWENAGTDVGLCGLLSTKWASYVNCPNIQSVSGPCDFKVKNQESGFIQIYTVGYQICSSNVNCGAMRFVDVNGGEEKTLMTGLAVGQGVKYWVCDSPGLSHNSVKPYETHINYGLFQYERGNKETISTSSCSVPYSANQCINCQSATEGDSTKIYNNPVSSLNPDTYSTYLKNWVYGPLQANFVTDTDGTMVDCSMRKVYSLNTIQTELGCSAYAYAFKRNVDCCPGDKLGTQSCGADFQWNQVDIGCCKGGICSIVNCDGQGGWYNPGTGTTYKKATSCNSDGTCSYQTINAPCAAPAIGCPTGQHCVIDANNPANNHCEGGTPCGDKNGDCFDDCTNQEIPNCLYCREHPNDPQCNPVNFDLNMLFGLLAFGIVFFSSGAIKKIKEQEYDSLAVVLIVSGIVGYATYWILSNLLAILAGSIILTILGGAILYFFGGIFIVIAAVIGMMIKAFRGD